jgi:hypothetical protein
MAIFIKIFTGVIQLGFLASLFYFAFSGKQHKGKELGWIYRILCFVLGSFIILGAAYFTFRGQK